MNHKDWLDNEYSMWIEALRESTVHNFKENPMVQRMLGTFEHYKPVSMYVHSELTFDKWNLLLEIDKIGFDHPITMPSPCAIRWAWWAPQILKKNPTSIVEIGGGVGQFYAIMRALGFEGDYFIYDLPEVKEFQNKYLCAVEHSTGLGLEQKGGGEFVVSLYCLGEFDEENKSWYIENVINKSKHGFIIWNPHSGASDDLSWIPEGAKVEPEYPLSSPNNKLITW